MSRNYANFFSVLSEHRPNDDDKYRELISFQRKLKLFVLFWQVSNMLHDCHTSCDIAAGRHLMKSNQYPGSLNARKQSQTY